MRRHPHVFADGDASTPAEVEQAWERIKAQEKVAGADGGGGYAADLLHGIPAGLPGDLAAEKVLARVRRRELTPAPDAVARLERARAALATAEADVRAALADLAASPSRTATERVARRPGGLLRVVDSPRHADRRPTAQRVVGPRRSGTDA